MKRNNNDNIPLITTKTQIKDFKKITNEANYIKQHKMSLLMSAIKAGNKFIFEYLIKNQINYQINFTNENKESALTIAIEKIVLDKSDNMGFFSQLLSVLDKKTVLTSLSSAHKNLLKIIVENNINTAFVTNSKSFLIYTIENAVNNQIIEAIIDKASINEINLQNSSGNNSLTFACQFNNQQIVEKLISKGANIDVLNKNGNTPLTIALKNQQPQILDSLLNRKEENYKLLYNLIKNDNTYNLLKQCEKDLDKSTKEHLLYLACQEGNNNFVLSLINDLGYKKIENPKVQEYLLKNVEAFELAKVLIQNNIDVNIKNVYGESIDLLKIFENSEEVARKLIEKGANYENSFFLACRQNNLKLVKFLIECDNNINVWKNHKIVNRVNQDYRSPLEIACVRSHVELAKVLIENGANFKKQDEKGLNIFWNAVVSHHSTFYQLELTPANVALLKLLIEYGVDPNIQKAKDGSPILHQVYMSNSNIEEKLEFTKFLIENKVNIHATNKDQDTILESLLLKFRYSDCRQMMELLIKNGANVNEIKGNKSILYRLCEFETDDNEVELQKIKFITLLINKKAILNDERMDNLLEPLKYMLLKPTWSTTDLEIIDILILGGADAHAIKNIAFSKFDILDNLLLRACDNERPILIKFLLQKGANPGSNFTTERKIPMMVAISKKFDIDILKELMISYVKFNNLPTKSGYDVVNSAGEHILKYILKYFIQNESYGLFEDLCDESTFLLSEIEDKDKEGVREKVKKNAQSIMDFQIHDWFEKSVSLKLNPQEMKLIKLVIDKGADFSTFGFNQELKIFIYNDLTKDNLKLGPKNISEYEEELMLNPLLKDLNIHEIFEEVESMKYNIYTLCHLFGIKVMESDTSVQDFYKQAKNFRDLFQNLLCSDLLEKFISGIDQLSKRELEFTSKQIQVIQESLKLIVNESAISLKFKNSLPEFEFAQQPTEEADLIKDEESELIGENDYIVFDNSN